MYRHNSNNSFISNFFSLAMLRSGRCICYGMMFMSILFFCGCSWWNNRTLRSQSPDEEKPVEKDNKLVGDMAVPFGVYPVKVEAIGMVTNLDGTGSDPAPSPQRDALLEEMQVRGVTNPNAILSSGKTSLVLVRGVLRPGIQKGDTFDIEVRVPGKSETTSLRGGYLLESRLTEMAVLGNRVHEGKLLAKAQGPVLVDPLADPKVDKVMVCRGRVLGGGVALKSRSLGLVLKPGHQTVFNSSKIANVVNSRFHSFQNGIKIGMAKAKTEEYIELTVHPRYKDNILRYVNVVRAVAIAESATERMERVVALEEQLQNSDTAEDAALQLEALGQEGIPVLLKAVQSKNIETRFRAAEALAYLDRHEAAAPLGEIAREQPAFRVFALTALSSMQDFDAFEQLRGMLSSNSAETRYGAFRAMWTMNKKDAMVAGERLNDQFYYHVLDVDGPPMVHVTHNRLPELILFGKNQRFQVPISVNAGNQIMINSTNSKEITISKFVVNEPDQKRVVSTKLDDVIRAVVELGGTYPDVVQMLQEAKTHGSLASRFEIDAIPEAGRKFERMANQEDSSAETAEDSLSANPSGKSKINTKSESTSSAPDLFYKKADATSDGGDDSEKTSKSDASEEKSEEKTTVKKGFFGKMFGVASKE